MCPSTGWSASIIASSACFARIYRIDCVFHCCCSCTAVAASRSCCETAIGHTRSLGVGRGVIKRNSHRRTQDLRHHAECKPAPTLGRRSRRALLCRRYAVMRLLSSTGKEVEARKFTASTVTNPSTTTTTTSTSTPSTATTTPGEDPLLQILPQRSAGPCARDQFR